LPRAIGWISTVSTDDVAKLAPIFFFTGAGRKPPMVCLTLQTKSDGVTPKDTFVNIRDTGEFCFNMATLEQAHQMHQTTFEFPPEVDEFDKTGLEKEPSVVVKAPRVKGAPISFECRLHKIVPVGDVGDHVIIGEVVLFHLRDDLYLERGRIAIHHRPLPGALHFSAAPQKALAGKIEPDLFYSPAEAATA
jgi:flavin reductase (DIM6/NTAB) family NADH-FMN oxidoreductase RutF